MTNLPVKEELKKKSDICRTALQFLNKSQKLIFPETTMVVVVGRLKLKIVVLTGTKDDISTFK